MLIQLVIINIQHCKSSFANHGHSIARRIVTAAKEREPIKGAVRVWPLLRRVPTTLRKTEAGFCEVYFIGACWQHLYAVFEFEPRRLIIDV